MGLTAVAGVVEAQVTTYVNPDGGFGEDERCLVGANGMCQGGAYNGAISIIHALEMDLGGSLVRVDDGLDRIWQAIANQQGNLVGRARYAADALRLGYDSGAGYVDLVGNIPTGQVRVTAANLGMFSGAQSTNYVDSFQAVGNWTPVSLAPGTLFAFILSDLTLTNRWTSNNSGTGVGSAGYANSGNLDDHMVTFQFSPTHYVIAFEDLPFSGSDRDYNDMVLEVRWLTPVPLPAALPLLLSGLLGLVGFMRRAGLRAPTISPSTTKGTSTSSKTVAAESTTTSGSRRI
jgi:hypothetical protein